MTFKSLKILYFAVILGLFNGGCVYFSNVELTPESFVGTWVLDNSSQSLILNGENTLKNTKLILSADNSFQLIDMPTCWFSSLSECTDSFGSYEGSWKLLKVSDRSYVLSLRMNNGNDVHGIEILRGYWNVENIELNFIAADADLGNIFVFVKQKA